VAPPLSQLRQVDRPGLIGVQQTLVGPRDPIQAGADLQLSGALPGGAGLGRGGEVIELREQPLRLGEQGGDMVPQAASMSCALMLRLGQAAVRALRMQSLPRHS
jgi:hypothetical protein